MKRRILIILGLSALVSLVTSLAIRHVYAQPQLPAFTANVVEKYLTAPDTYGLEESYSRAYKADGSFVKRREYKAPDGRIVEQRNVYDLASGRRVVVEGITESTVTYRLSPQEVAWRRSRVGQCSSNPLARRSSRLGYEVIENIYKYQTPQGDNQVVEWRAPMLNCAPLEERYILTKSDGSEFVTNIRTVVNIAMGEPDSSLFSIPARYVERSPSAMMEEYARRYDPSSPARDYSKLDQAYLNSGKPYQGK